jgi:hypothetical protein
MHWNLLRIKKEVMLPYGIGYKGFGSCHIYNKHRRVSAFIIDETIIQISDENFSGCGFVLNQFINRCLEYIYF